MRSPLGLVGNTLNVDLPSWERHDSGIGAGIDSFYEYLLKVHGAKGWLHHILIGYGDGAQCWGLGRGNRAAAPHAWRVWSGRPVMGLRAGD